jgi:hypothetical protein
MADPRSITALDVAEKFAYDDAAYDAAWAAYDAYAAYTTAHSASSTVWGAREEMRQKQIEIFKKFCG